MELCKIADDELVELFYTGCNQAFDTLLERHKDRLYNYILAIVRVPEMAEDIFQDTFTKAIMYIKQGRYTGSGKFIAWLFRMAHNEMIDMLRRDRLGATISNDEREDFDLFNDQSLTDENIEQKLVREQILSDVGKLVDHLPDNQREVIQMRYYQGLSFKEIAEKTGVSINTALGRMRYAVLNMRSMAEEHNITLSL